MTKKISLGQPQHFYSFAGEENNLFEPKFPVFSAGNSENDANPILIESQTVEVQSGPVNLNGILNIPVDPKGLVIFVDNDSQRHRLHQSIAYNLLSAGLATLAFDLLTLEEKEQDALAERLYADIGLLARRAIGAMDWISQQPQFQSMRLGCFGSRIGAPAALIAAAERPEITGAVVSCGGQLVLGSAALARIHAPVLLVIGEQDQVGSPVNQQALAKMNGGARKEVRVVQGASDLFDAPGTYETVANISTSWFKNYLQATAGR